MSIDEISRVIGNMEATLRGVASDLKDIKEGKTGLCRQHDEAIQRLENRACCTKPTKNGDGSTNWIELGRGTLKAHGWPSLIFAALLAAFLYIKYSQPKQMEQVAKTVAETVVAQARADMNKEKDRR